MPNVVEDIPTALEPAATAALAWINEDQGTAYRLTGLVDPEPALRAAPGEAFELGLVLCEGDHCTREQVRVAPGRQGFAVERCPSDDPGIPALLDPPAGVRIQWLDEQLARHKFIVLLYYRGLW